jgi:translation initiation factor 3 subunit L
MSLRQGIPTYQDAPARAPEDESDAEEDALVDDYKEQVRYAQDGGLDELDRTASLGQGGNQDIHAQLAAAATPLEFQATLETKFASYDNYCSLFHFILNSEGPVDLEVPSVRLFSTGL